MRQVAKHVWIQEILSGRYEEKEGWEPNVLHTGRGPVSRVNILGTLLSIDGTLFLDDGTGKILLRSFDEVPGLQTASTGSFVLVIGRPRVYQKQVFVVPEIVREVNPAWGVARKQELGGVETSISEPESEPVVEEFVENKAEKIVGIVHGLDEGDGVDVDVVIKKSELAGAEEIINQLLLDGELFEIKPGVVKVL